MPATTIPIPGLVLVSEANARGHWSGRAGRAKRQRATVGLILATRTEGRELRVHNGAITVTVTRVSPRALDSDNLASSAKAVRDAVALWLNRDDGVNSGVVWEYGQRKAGKGEAKQGVVIEVRW